MPGVTGSVQRDMAVVIFGDNGIFVPADAFIGLFTAFTDNGPNTVLADLTQATGAMATRQAIDVWSTPHLRNDGSYAVNGIPPAIFTPANSSQAQTVLGWFVSDDAAAGNLLAWGLFSQPIPLPDQYSSVQVQILGVIPGGNIYTEANVVNG